MFQKKCYFLTCIGLILLLVKSSTELSLSQIDNVERELTSPRAALDFYCNSY
jgi:hypothetical protein